MLATTRNRMTPPLVLHTRTAAELMTPDPKSLRQDALVAEAAVFLSARGFSAAPVIDEAGRPVGVVSRTDLLHHHGQRAARLLTAPPGTADARAEAAAPGAIRDVMTPAVFCVHAETPAAKVVEKMLALNVRRLFVVDEAGVLVGVVSAFDVLRGLGEPFRAAG
ncbi:CBS domain-containing protein [bacterium]|nr:CBS domain-containing protein [bacterium]